MTTDEQARTELAELLPDFRFAMVTTIDESGKLTAVPLTVQEREFDGDLWFIIDRRSSTVTHLRSNDAVGIALNGSSSWVSLAGTGEVVDDLATLKEFWNPAVEAWFPEGPEDPDITLLRFEADSGEYWSSPGGRVATVIGLIKSKLTGETYEGNNEKVDL